MNVFGVFCTPYHHRYRHSYYHICTKYSVLRRNDIWASATPQFPLRHLRPGLERLTETPIGHDSRSPRRDLQPRWLSGVGNPGLDGPPLLQTSVPQHPRDVHPRVNHAVHDEIPSQPRKIQKKERETKKKKHSLAPQSSDFLPKRAERDFGTELSTRLQPRIPSQECQSVLRTGFVGPQAEDLPLMACRPPCLSRHMHSGRLGYTSNWCTTADPLLELVLAGCLPRVFRWVRPGHARVGFDRLPVCMATALQAHKSTWA